MSEYIVKKSWWLRVFDPEYVEHRKYPGWTGFLPFYRIQCPVHGEIVDYPHGYARRLTCPMCRKEETR